jgi:hypothetical protein
MQSWELQRIATSVTSMTALVGVNFPVRFDSCRVHAIISAHRIVVSNSGKIRSAWIIAAGGA